MFIRLLLICLHILISQVLASCPNIRTSVVLAECMFDTNLYLSLGANILNTKSIGFTGYYAFNNNNNVNNALIYNLGNRWMLLVPLLIKCSQEPINITFTECQYTIRQSKYSNQLSSTAEYMTTQLSVINVTDIGMKSVLFLQPGDIFLRSCKAFDCSNELVYIIPSNETFHFRIDYEKPIDTICYNDNDCQRTKSIKSSIYCDKSTNTCQCQHENISRIDVSGIGRLCVDSIDQSNCTINPKRCLKWCDESDTSNCLCPKLTRKVRKINGAFDCELEPEGICKFDDDHIIGPNIRKCPTGTYCDRNRCRSSIVLRHQLDEYRNDIQSSSTMSISNYLTSTFKYSKFQNETMSLIRTMVIVGMSILVTFILIILILTIIIKTKRSRAELTTSDDKCSSSSFVQSTTTAISNDSTTNNNHQQQGIPTITSVNYKSYINRSTLVHGLVPQANLSARFHRPQQSIDDKRRTPLQIRSPSLSRINPFTDHASLTTNEYSNRKRPSLPKVTRLQNGDVIISA